MNLLLTLAGKGQDYETYECKWRFHAQHLM